MVFHILKKALAMLSKEDKLKALSQHNKSYYEYKRYKDIQKYQILTSFRLNINSFELKRLTQKS